MFEWQCPAICAANRLCFFGLPTWLSLEEHFVRKLLKVRRLVHATYFGLARIIHFIHVAWDFILVNDMIWLVAFGSCDDKSRSLFTLCLYMCVTLSPLLLFFHLFHVNYTHLPFSKRDVSQVPLPLFSSAWFPLFKINLRNMK